MFQDINKVYCEQCGVYRHRDFIANECPVCFNTKGIIKLANKKTEK